MQNYNDQYYVCVSPEGEERIFPKTNQRTKSADYSYTKQKEGSAPFFFDNAYKEDDLAEGNQWPIPDILVSNKNVLIVDKLYDKLMGIKINGLQLHSAVYIDDNDDWNENYWFLIFYERLDCWDRERSIILKKERALNGSSTIIPAKVEQFYLDGRVLDQIPEEQRLMFTMGGVVNKFVFFHQKIVDIISTNNFTGARFIKVSEFDRADAMK
jgi:hypothetical protein